MLKPWLQYYGDDLPETVTPICGDVLSLFERAVAKGSTRPFIYYFDAVISYGEADALTDALASGLQAAVYVQNMPQFILTTIAAWKTGATLVSINPMLVSEELTKILNDCGARVLVALDEIYLANGAAVIDETPVECVITTWRSSFSIRLSYPRCWQR